MPGPYIKPQEFFDTSTIPIPTVTQIATGMPPFIVQGAVPGCYAALVAAIVASIPGSSSPTGAESSLVQVVTSGISANVKGAWVQMIASTAKAVLGLLINVSILGFNISGTFDIGLGSAGNEVATFKDLGLISGINTTDPFICFACSIPINTRISIRAADSNGSEPYRFNLSCLE